MAYQLGVDLGTTYTAAAIGRNGHAEIFSLGSVGAVMPSVVLVRADGEVLVGDAAVRRGLSEPTRVAREFKRRLGDPTPLVLGGAPFGAETLMGYLLREVVRQATLREGSPPDRIVLTCPASFGPYKLDMMRAVARAADLDSDKVMLVSEPQAAAISYAARDRVAVGTTVAVYDFGGGTLDTALVRRTTTGFDLIGRPEGMDRFGGIDIDAALVSFVDDRLDGAIAALDPDDPMVKSGMARLRDDCRAAKEALSSDSDAAIAVSLPGIQRQVTVTRSDLDAMIRPRLRETVEALRRSVTSAGLTLDQVDRVLLVGGSSAIPLVSRAVAEGSGRPTVADAQPKFSVCQGAALAGQAVPDRPAAPAPAAPPAPVVAPAPRPATPPPPPAAPRPGPSPATTPPPPRSGGGRRTALVAAGALVAVLVAVVVVVLARHDAGDDTTSADTTVATSADDAPDTRDTTISTDAPDTTTRPPTAPTTDAPFHEIDPIGGTATGTFDAEHPAETDFQFAARDLLETSAFSDPVGSGQLLAVCDAPLGTAVGTTFDCIANGLTGIRLVKAHLRITGDTTFEVFEVSDTGDLTKQTTG